MSKICKQFISNDYYDDCFDFHKMPWNVNYWKTAVRLIICPYNQTKICPYNQIFPPSRFVLHHTMLQPEVIMAIISKNACAK